MCCSGHVSSFFMQLCAYHSTNMLLTQMQQKLLKSVKKLGRAERKTETIEIESSGEEESGSGEKDSGDDDDDEDESDDSDSDDSDDDNSEADNDDPNFPLSPTDTPSAAARPTGNGRESSGSGRGTKRGRAEDKPGRGLAEPKPTAVTITKTSSGRLAKKTEQYEACHK